MFYTGRHRSKVQPLREKIPGSLGAGFSLIDPYIGYIGMCGARGYGFLAVWSEIGYQF